jgi:hypothetical protein
MKRLPVSHVQIGDVSQASSALSAGKEAATANESIERRTSVAVLNDFVPRKYVSNFLQQRGYIPKLRIRRLAQRDA